nr:hypothetical protein [uncultured Acidocella sp.]
MADAEQIVGGWVYFHPAKAKLSEFGGVVVSVEPTTELSGPDKPEIAIILEFRPESREQKWRGAEHGMAWCSGLVSPSFEHELGS